MTCCLIGVAILVAATTADLPTFNNIGYLGFGYNQFTGNPQDEGFDQGLTVPVFDTSRYTLGTTTVDGTYKIPDGVDAHRASSCNSESISREILDENDFANILKHSFEANFTGVPFSANGMFQRISQRCRKNRDVFVDSISSCEQYAARILMYDPPPFSNDFLSGVAELPSEYTADNRDTFVKFLTNFGTHVVTKIWMGSKLIRTYGMSETEFAELLGVGFNVKLAAALQTGKIMGKIGTSTSLERSKELQSFLAQHMLIEEMIGTPEDPPQEFLDKWLPMRLNEPAPVRYALTKISAFVGKERRDAVEKAFSEFCLYIGGQCEPKESLLPPVPICPSVRFDLDQTRHTGPCTYGMSVVQQAHPTLICPGENVLTGVQLSVGKGCNHLRFNVGCSTRFDISLESGDWVSPVLVSPSGSDGLSSRAVTCPEGYYASGLGFIRNCITLQGSNTFASLKCSKSSQPIKSVGFTQWSSLPMPSSPLYSYLTCNDGGIVCGIEFRGEKDISWPNQAYRLRCCQVGPKCLTRHRILNAALEVPSLPIYDEEIIPDPGNSEEEEEFFSSRVNLDDKQTEFFSGRSLVDLGSVQFYSSRFEFDIANAFTKNSEGEQKQPGEQKEPVDGEELEPFESEAP